MKRKFLLKFLWIWLVALLSSMSLFAQQKTVKGTVTDSGNQPLIGVTVALKGTTKGTITTATGNYSITVPDNKSVLVFSYLGYVTQEVPVGDRTNISIVMADNSAALREVVVVGYGTQRKADLTGSISQVKASDVNATATGNIANALQGRAAGVAVTTSNAPGVSPTIRVRGSNSITAGNNPLLVVDGVPLENGNLGDINSDDIATMDILKDASSTAIYGSRGANGVIMITTKKGAAGKNTVNISSYYGIQQRARLIDMISGQTFIDFINTAYTNQKGTGFYTSARPAPTVTDVDWQRALIKPNAPLQDYNISFSGGTDKTRYLLSAGIFSQDGLLLAQDFKRYSLRLNLEQKMNSFLTVGTHLQLSRSITDANNPGTDNVFRFGWPTLPIRKPDGSFYYASENPADAPITENTRWNPVADAGQITDQTGVNRALGDIYLELKFLKNFTFRTNLGADFPSSQEYYYAPSTSTAGFNAKGSGSLGIINERQVINENVLTYDNRWKEHHLTATAVLSYQNHDTETIGLSGKTFPTDLDGYWDAAAASLQNPPATNKYNNRLLSYTGRVSYAYSDRYLLTMTGRYDGSSRFGANNKWGFFPSIGLGWNVINEQFMTGLKNIFSQLKLRGSLGFTGNQEIGNYNSLSLLSTTYYVSNSTNLLVGTNEGLGNPNLKWEKTRQIDAGVDIGLWNDVLNLSADYYKKNTKDLLYKVPIPTTSGYKSVLENIGEVLNEGFEIAANVNIINNSRLKWSLGGNISHNTNRILQLYGGVQSVVISDNQGIARYLNVGKSINEVYARKSAGIIQTDAQLAQAKTEQPKNSQLWLGSEKYVDVNGDGNITNADYVPIGSTDPNLYYGVNTSLSYKRFTLDVLGQGASGAVDPLTNYNIMGDNQIGNRIYIPSQYAYDRMWSSSNPTGTFPRAGAKDVQFSDRTNGNIRFFVIRNIRLGYNFDPQWIKKLSLQSLNIYVNAQNYFSYSSFRGYNPENGDVQTPFAKTMLFGANITF